MIIIKLIKFSLAYKRIILKLTERTINKIVLMSKKIFLIIFSFFIVRTIFPQSVPVDNKKNKFNISNYIGFAPSQSEVTFYIGTSGKVIDKIAVGLKGGIYNYDITIDEASSAIFEKIYYATYSNPGFYTAIGVPIVKQNFTYAGSITGEYFFKKNLSVEFSAGLKYYLQKSYTSTLDWTVPYEYAPISDDYTFSNIGIVEEKDIYKAYYSAGFNYTVNNFKMGIFGDNIYSFGANIGILF